MARTCKKLAVILALPGIAACATAPPPAAPPVLTFDGSACAATPDLSSATLLTLASNKPVKVSVDAATPCMERMQGGKGVYVGFQLPQSVSDFMISVASTPVGQGLFSPRLQLLDSAGKVMREVQRDAFVFRGSSLYAGLRVRPGERYLIVISDTESIGQEVSQISTNTQANVAAAGGYYFAVHSGSERASTFVYALNGALTVAAEPIPK